MGFLDNQQVGNRLNTKRLATGLTSRKFALKAGIDPSQYAKIEKGELPITAKILQKITGTYEVNEDEILYGKDVPQTDKKTPMKPRDEASPNLLDTLARALDNISDSNKNIAETNKILGRLAEENQKIILQYLLSHTEHLTEIKTGVTLVAAIQKSNYEFWAEHLAPQGMTSAQVKKEIRNRGLSSLQEQRKEGK